MDTYKCLWTFDKKLSFWWYWNARKFKNVSYPVKILISSQKFRDISRNFVIFRDTKFREINISRNFATAKFRRPPYFRDRKNLNYTFTVAYSGLRHYTV
jgi:hypothetical protein